MREPLEIAGFRPPIDDGPGRARRAAAFAALAATAGLAASTLVAAVALTIDVARAHAPESVVDNEGGLFGLALLLGLLFLAMTGLSLAPRDKHGER
ncbi:MAG: hypothetical protein IRY89_11425 [Pseudolabrys sp.]|nr:hypothetical protein [Pseudolabrys sp.]